MNRKILIYQDHNGNEPFVEWINKLKDIVGKCRILRRIDRLENGNFGDHKSVGEGVQELRMNFGPGYRVYFAQEGDNIVLLLCGGDKSTQSNDITLAKAYWKDYKEHKDD